MIAEIGRAGRHTLTLKTLGFRADVVDTIKMVIPKHARHWNIEAKLWEIDSDYESFLVAALDCIGVDVRHVGQADEEPTKPKYQQTKPLGDCFSVLYVLPSAPIEVAEAAYRALSKMWHPDHLEEQERFLGHIQMKRINQAVEEVREKLAVGGAA